MCVYVYSFFFSLSLLCSGPLSLCCSETLYWQAWGGCWYCSTLSAVNPGSALHPVWHHKELWRLPTGKQNHHVCGQQISTTVLFQGSFYCSAWSDLRSKFLQLLVLWVWFFCFLFFSNSFSRPDCWVCLRWCRFLVESRSCWLSWGPTLWPWRMPLTSTTRSWIRSWDDTMGMFMSTCSSGLANPPSMLQRSVEPTRLYGHSVNAKLLFAFISSVELECVLYENEDVGKSNLTLNLFVWSLCTMQCIISATFFSPSLQVHESFHKYLKPLRSKLWTDPWTSPPGRTLWLCRLNSTNLSHEAFLFQILALLRPW